MEESLKRYLNHVWAPVWAPVTFSKALIKFSKELLKNFWPKKDFFYCDLVFEEVYYCDLVFWVRKNDSTTCQ